MSLPYGLLGLLSYQDSTGYDLTKIFEGSLNYFWRAQSSQIYRELDRMEQNGWLVSRSIVQDKRPNKRLYSITKLGSEELAKWLSVAEPPVDNPHIPLLIRVFFGADDPKATLAMLTALRDKSLAALESFSSSVMGGIRQHADEVSGGEKRSLYWEMTLDYGIADARMTAQWAQSCIDKIEKELQS